MNRIEFHAMGCQMHAILDSDDPHAARALAEVPCWFEKWEQCLSRFRDSSELVALNGQSGNAVRVSETLWQVARLALQAAAQTDGLITPTILDVLEAAGYDRPMSDSASTAADSTPIFSAGRAPYIGDWREVELDAHRHTIRLPRGVRLDLAGVAKGWAAEQAVRRLASGVPALVNASGDIVVSGPRADGTAWAVGIEHPLGDDEDLPLLLISHQAVTTSSRGYRRWLREGIWQHHLIDPRTAAPAQTDVFSATVVAPTIIEAEVAAKVVLILGSRAGMDWIQTRPELGALLILENGAVHANQQLESCMWREDK